MKRPLVLIFLVLLLVNGLLAFYYFFRLRPSQDRQIREDIKKEVSFLCPVPVEYCESGRVVEIDGAYLGVGYQVPEGTPILAVLSGQVKGSGVTYRQSAGGGRYPGLILTDLANDIVVHYVLTGEDFSELINVDKGEQILLAREGKIANFGVNLIISVYQNIGEGQEEVKLEPKDFR